MKKRFCLYIMLVLIILFSLVFSSCFTLMSAATVEIAHASKLNKEAEITSGNGIKWRSELTYEEIMKYNIDSSGLWYIGDIPLYIQNLNADSKYNGIAIMHCIQNNSYSSELALVEAENNPAGEESSITVKKLGEVENITWTIKYILSADGSSFNIIDLGGLNSPPLRIGQYLNSDAKKDANRKAIEGYGSFTVKNKSSNHSITKITISGGQNKRFSQTYQVNLEPVTSGALGILGGGSFEVGDEIAGKKVIPIGDYELILDWSNGARSTYRVTITGSGSIGNYNQ